MKKKYKFASAVYATGNDKNGVNAVAYVGREEEEKSLKCYHDLEMKYISWKEIVGSAKFVFYCQEN